MNAFPPRCRAQFEPVRLIASGGFGSVHLARQVALDRPVAIKLLDPARLADREEVARFLNEARVTATLTHPGIVVLIDHDVEDGLPWIAYEYVPGRTLRAILDAGPLDVPRALAAVRQVAEALQAAHERGVIHRDIKPENVLEVEEGRYKVADFGIAKWSSGGVHTQAGLILGTPAYLAPEQVLGEVATAATDLYALGIVLHELLAGKPPFGGEVSALRDHVSTSPPPIPRADVPAPVQDLVYRLLAKKPADRHEDASALVSDISRMMESHGTAMPSDTVRLPRARSPRPASFSVAPPPEPRRRGPLAAALFGIVLLAAGALWIRPGARDAAEPLPSASPSPSASPTPLGAIVARYLPEYEALVDTDQHRAALIARMCLSTLIRADAESGPAQLPARMCRSLIDLTAVRQMALHAAVTLPVLNPAQEREHADLARLAAELGDAVFVPGRELHLQQLCARVTVGVLSRKFLNGVLGDAPERPLVQRIGHWRRRRPELVGPLMLEAVHALETGHKHRVASKSIEILNLFARVHLPPRGPEPDVAMLEEWYRLVCECYGNTRRAGGYDKLHEIADIHARTFPRFGALMGHRATIRDDLARKFNGLSK